MSPMLEVRSVTQRFGGVVALDDISLTIAPGEVVGIVGANGAGKSTLFDVISGIREPSRGHVVLDGTDITGWQPHRVSRAGMARTFQRNLVFGDLTVSESLELVLQRRRGGYWKMWSRAGATGEWAEELDRILRTSALDDVRHVRAGDLSHGLQRQLEVAMAIAADAKVLLFDEPTQGMSLYETRQMTAVLATLRSQGATMAVIEHDLNVVDQLVDRLVVLHLGALLADGTPAEVRSMPAVQEAFLGVQIDDA